LARHSHGVRGLALLIALACVSRTAEAADAPTDAEADAAVALATNAFEYRDFKKVVEALTPWLHPPRITNTKTRITARRLLGVSLHVLGEISGAKEEFSQLLLEDPLHKLDPFVVPPPVIETFETVRKEMKPTLDRVLKERGQNPDPEPPKKTVLVPAASRVVAFLPGGFPQFQLEETGLGFTFLAVQAIAFVANVLSYARGRAIHDSGGDDRTWVGVQYVSLGIFGAAWATSAILGNNDLSTYNKDLMKEPPKAGALSF
jgi:hypothetical protein